MISAGTFAFDILLSVGDTPEQIIKYLDKNYRGALTDEERKLIEFDKTIKGRTIFLENNAQIVWLRDGRNFPVLAHEMLHATAFILGKVGIEFSEKTDEVYAYLQQYLIEQAIKVIKSK